jgi:hypothetical protein
MRPGSVVWFERLMLGSLVIGLIQTAIAWPTIMARMTRLPTVAPYAGVFMIGVIGFVTALTLTLVLLVSRRRSKVAKWILIVLFIIGLPGLIRSVSTGTYLGSTPLFFGQIAAQLVAYGLLFAYPTLDWLNRRDERPDLTATFS